MRQLDVTLTFLFFAQLGSDYDGANNYQGLMEGKVLNCIKDKDYTAK